MKKIVVYLLLVLMGIIPIAAYAQTIDVLTYNIRYDNPKDSLDNWNNRKDFLISQLSFYEPDIFGTQEGLIHQLTALKNGLEGYDYIGKGRDFGDKAGEFSAIFYNRHEVELLNENMFWLSETPKKPSKGWDAAIKRICTYALFKVKNSQTIFWVFNTHFDHIGQIARKESIKLISKKIKEINAEDFPVILMGDFNLEPDHSGIQFLATEMNDTKMMAGDKAFGPDGTFNGFNFTKPITRRIDYIFISRNDYQLIKYAVLSDSKDCRYPSDHLPVYVKLKFKK